MAAVRDNNKGLIRRVRAAQHKIGMQDADYRALLSELFGATSTTQLTTQQLNELMTHFSCERYRNAQPRRRKFIEIPKTDPLHKPKRKILAMCKDLGWSISYLNGRIEMLFGVSRIEFLRDQKATEALINYMSQRMKKKGLNSYPERS